MLFKSNKIEVRESSLHGYGVFANEDISKDEKIEECHCVIIRKDYAVGEELDVYTFGYDDTIAIVFGFASIYNSSEGEDNQNVEYSIENEIYTFKAIKDIKKDEELLLNY